MVPAARKALIWTALAGLTVAPIAVAATSPLLAWRDPIYIAAGLAGVVALALLPVQPLLAAGRVPGLEARRGRRVHAWIGVGLVAAVVLHVAGLWVTSPPDVIDALLFRSPTPFSAWGVAAMWATLAAAALAGLRRRLPAALWRPAHAGLALTTVGAGVLHAMPIEGTMGTASKAALCALALAAAVKATADLRSWTPLTRLIRRPGIPSNGPGKTRR